MANEQKNEFTLEAFLYKIRLILSGTGLAIFPLTLLAFGIIAFTSLFLFFVYFREFPLLGLIAFIAVLFFLYDIALKIISGINSLARRKNSLPLFFPEKKLETSIAMLLGDKRKGLKSLSDEKSFTLEPPKGDIIDNEVLKTEEAQQLL